MVISNPEKREGKLQIQANLMANTGSGEKLFPVEISEVRLMI
jgi:hypothetical protein